MPAAKYNQGNGTPPSTPGSQIIEWAYNRAAVVEEARQAYFRQLSDIKTQPKNTGKKIKTYRVRPILHDDNINTQGIDMDGNSGQNSKNPDGNLYGSSRDIGVIKERMPVLGEVAGRVNEVGMTRVELESDLHKYGVFTEWSEDLINFDTMEDLKMHLYRELGRLKGELIEDLLMTDLVETAGTVTLFGGTATQISEITGESPNPSVLTYPGLRRLTKELNQNRAPMDSKIVTGSLKTDTKTIPAARYAYVNDNLRLQLEDILDQFGNPAFIPVEKYADATSIALGEVGKAERFRFIENTRMGYLGGQGDAVGANPDGYAETNGNYDVHIMLVIGSGAFTTVGFQTNGKEFNFIVNETNPNEGYPTRDNPYLDVGIYSMKFYYGFLALRPDWIAKYYVVAKP
jgi:N4-gp56 family major capsid protein